LSPIICTWLESPKAALHAESYCKLVAHTVVELWQHKIGKSSESQKIVQLQVLIAWTGLDWTGIPKFVFALRDMQLKGNHIRV